MEEQPKEKKKFVIVDGANFWNMCRILRIGRTNLEKFYRILVDEIGSLPLAHKPVYVLNRYGLERTLQSFDFEADVVTGNNGEDDEEIKKRIKAVSPNEIGEIILVSGDGGYYEALKEKVSAGVKVYIVAIPENIKSLYRNALHGDDALFTYIDLTPYKDVLLLDEWIDKFEIDQENKKLTREENNDVPAGGMRVLSLTIEGDSSNMNTVQGMIMNLFIRLLRQHPDISFEVSVKDM